MVSAAQVAQFFLACTDPESGDATTHLKLQKLVYYAQAWHLAKHGTPLFPETIEAWRHGPAVGTVYQQYKSFGYGAIDVSRAEVPDLPAGVETHLRWIWDTYGAYEAWFLSSLTHRELPWIRARAGLPLDSNSGRPIQSEWMTEFYRAMREPDLPPRPPVERPILHAAEEIERARRSGDARIPWEQIRDRPHHAGV